MKSLSPTAFLRITLGATICGHGIMKVMGGPGFWEALGGMPPMIPDIAWLQMILGSLATLVELLGGLCLVLNFRVRLAAIAIVVIMLFAFSYHLPNVKDFRTLMTNTWPLEMAFVYASIAWMHPGKK